MEVSDNRDAREGIARIDLLDKLERLIEPLRPDYRTAAITEGFDWPSIISDLTNEQQIDRQKLYLVVFRSTRWPETDDALVTQLDTAAHTEARTSSELLHYFAGPVENRQAMSWCLWTDMIAARQALDGPAHQLAARHARQLYSDFSVELYDVYPQGEDGVVFDTVSRS